MQNSQITTALSDEERATLAAKEERIGARIQSFLEVGNDLADIRDARLYRESHATFEDYCRERWNFSKTHANRLVFAAEAAADLAPIGVTPESESQVRPLAALVKPEERREAMQVAVKMSAGKPLTAKVVKVAVEQVKAQEPQVVHVEVVTPAPSVAYAPDNARGLVTMAIVQLEKIKRNDLSREKEFDRLGKWIANSIGTTQQPGSPGDIADGLMHAGNAISQLAKIRPDDPERAAAFSKLLTWIQDRQAEDAPQRKRGNAADWHTFEDEALAIEQGIRRLARVTLNSRARKWARSTICRMRAALAPIAK